MERAFSLKLYCVLICIIGTHGKLAKSLLNFKHFRILNNRKKLLNNGNKWSIETCDQGMQNCVKAGLRVKSQVHYWSKDLHRGCELWFHFLFISFFINPNA